MSSRFIIIRHELVANAVDAIGQLYADKLIAIQSVKDGDGKQLKQIYWGAATPISRPTTVGFKPQWIDQTIDLELRASVDYQDRSLDSRYLLLLEVFEDFCARDDLATRLTSSESDGIKVISPPEFGEIEESIDNGRYVTTYKLRVVARGKVTGE